MAAPPVSKKLYFLGAARLEDRVLVASHANSASVTLEPIHNMIAELNSAQMKDKQLYSFGHGSVAWRVMQAEGLILVLCTAADYPNAIAKACLEELESTFVAKFQDKVVKAKEGSLNAQAKGLLTTLCDRYDDLTNVSTIHKTMAKVEAVKLVVQETVETALENSVQLDAIGKKTADLERNARRFRVSAQVMRRKMCWRSAKMNLVVAGTIFISVGIIVVVIMAQTGAFQD